MKNILIRNKDYVLIRFASQHASQQLASNKTQTVGKEQKTQVSLIKKAPQFKISSRTQVVPSAILRLGSKKNNFFVNVTDLDGRTRIKYSTGLFEGKIGKVKKTKKTINKFVQVILSWACLFIHKHFKRVRIFIKTDKTNASTYLRHLNRDLSFLGLLGSNDKKIVTLQVNIPTPHNGCRAPKKRRI